MCNAMPCPIYTYTIAPAHTYTYLVHVRLGVKPLQRQARDPGGRLLPVEKEGGGREEVRLLKGFEDGRQALRALEVA